MIDKLLKFFGKAVKYDDAGQKIWAVQDNGHHQMVADVRGWGAIQNLLMESSGKIDFDKAAEFQKLMGEFVTEAIREKIHKEKLSNSLKTVGTESISPRGFLRDRYKLVDIPAFKINEVSWLDLMEEYGNSLITRKLAPITSEEIGRAGNDADSPASFTEGAAWMRDKMNNP